MSMREGVRVRVSNQSHPDFLRLSIILFVTSVRVALLVMYRHVTLVESPIKLSFLLT